jgi:hypothetical protein
MSDVETAQTGAEVAPVENPAQPEQARTESATEQVEAQEQNDKPRDDKGRFVPQERVNEITRARREAERRAQYLEQELAAMRSQQPSHHQPQQHDRPPALQDYATPEEWGAAIADYSARRALSQAEQRFQQHDQFRTQQQIADQFAAKEAAFAATHPDYMERVGEMVAAVPLPQEILNVIGSSDLGVDVAYHLATHLDVADRLARMSPVAAAVEIGRIEARLSAPKPSKPVTNAPAPVPTVGGGSIASKDPDRMTVEEWMAHRNAQNR